MSVMDDAIRQQLRILKLLVGAFEMCYEPESAIPGLLNPRQVARFLLDLDEVASILTRHVEPLIKAFDLDKASNTKELDRESDQPPAHSLSPVLTPSESAEIDRPPTPGGGPRRRGNDRQRDRRGVT